MMKLVFRVIMNALSLAINLGLAYFAVKLILLFRGGEMEAAWRYILAGVLALATSSSIFVLHYLLSLEGTVHPIAGLIMMVGGALILAGLHTEYKKWTMKRFLVEKFLAHSITSSSRTQRHAFSATVGLNHQQMVGRKILFEFDPASSYEKAIRDFVTESLANAEPVVVFTRRGSAIHSCLNEQKAVKFFCLTQEVSAPRELSDSEILLPSNDTSLMLDIFNQTLKIYNQDNINIVFDNLSDLVLSIGSEKTYNFMRYVAEMLASPRVTCLFLINKVAHDPTVVSSLRGLFSNHLSFGKGGIQTIKLPENEVSTVEIERLAGKK